MNIPNPAFLGNNPAIATGYNLSFDVGIATFVGLNAAIVYSHMCYWIKRNTIEKKNFQDGKYWTYNSYPEMQKYMPYLTVKQIRSAVEALVEAGMIIRGFYNPSKLDRTSWYSLADPAKIYNKFFDSNNFTDVPCGADRSAPEGRCNMPDLADAHITSSNTQGITSTPTPSSPAATPANEPADAGGVCGVDTKHIKAKTAASYSPEVRALAAAVVAAIQAANSAYRPPADLLKQVHFLVDTDKHPPEQILKVLTWALQDDTIHGDFSGWASVVVGKNGMASLRRNYASLVAKMNAKTERKFDPCSNFSKIQANLDDWNRRAL